MRQSRLFLLLLGGLLALAPGCGGRKPVQVLVTLDGKPVAGATVTLVPEGGGVESGSGFTGSDGTATLTAPKNKGILPGKYKVVVTKFAKMELPADKKNLADVMQKMSPGKGSKRRSELPASYGLADKTTLTLKVPPDSVPAKLELTSKQP
jgi:hypothetical protein